MNISLRVRFKSAKGRRSVQLLEPDVVGVFPEALSAHVQAVLPDEAVTVGAGAAGTNSKL